MAKVKPIGTKTKYLYKKISQADEYDRIMYLLNLFSKGYNSLECQEMFLEHFPKLERATYYYWRKKAMQEIEKRRERSAQEIVNKQMLRLDNILQMALDRNDYKAANQIIDTMNKTLGVYNVKQEVTVQPITHFSFGNDVPQTTITAIKDAIGMDGEGETGNSNGK